MRALPSSLRKQLETSVLAARRAAEAASRAAIDSLGVFADRRPEHLDAAQAALRNGLRAKWRQLGNDRDLLVAECAYEQWHRLLFARFLAENGLLLHPQFRAPVTLAECEELTADLGEPDAWSVAARFAAEILPGIFRLDDPCVRLRLAPEGRHALEQILDAILAETFIADDALGWVYQFWQKDKKDEVNASERKIGGADLGPVTQLFTENYMVRFLLENSLGAWWATRNPDSPLVKGIDWLRFDDGGEPAVGAFGGWPDRVAEVTVMDPCCGSGHFLVKAFSMLWQMRAEEEGLAPVEAQDAVLRDNLFGLELDPRCVQIAMFNVALQAWKAGGGWRQLPVPNIACSGITVKAPVEEWKTLARGDERLEKALMRLHILFREADTLGSLIDPKRATEITHATGLQASFEDVRWEEVIPILDTVLDKEDVDPASDVLGADAAGIARAADYLSSRAAVLRDLTVRG
jgi:MmeI, DNA-methyltransferase domain